MTAIRPRKSQVRQTPDHSDWNRPKSHEGYGRRPLLNLPKGARSQGARNEGARSGTRGLGGLTQKK